MISTPLYPDFPAWLASTRTVILEQLLTVTLASGQVNRYASSALDVKSLGDTYLGSLSAGSLLFKRSRLGFKAGLEMPDCSLTIFTRPTDLLGSLPFAQGFLAGEWDNATFLISTAYLDGAGLVRAIVPQYQGKRGQAKLLDGVVTLTLKPPSLTLNRSVPPVYQASCLNTVFDAACGVSRAAFTFTGTVAAGSTATVIQTSLGQADGFFAGGVITFTSGSLTGLARTVRSHAAGGACTLFESTLAAPNAGDSFTVSAGCDRSLGNGGCAKFANRLRFRGYPFIPLPETSL